MDESGKKTLKAPKFLMGEGSCWHETRLKQSDILKLNEGLSVPSLEKNDVPTPKWVLSEHPFFENLVWL